MSKEQQDRPPHSRRVPRPSLRRRSTDPFYVKDDRNNFPGLDEAFLSDAIDVEATPKMGSSSKRYSSRAKESSSSSSSLDRDPSSLMLDRSVCFDSSSLPSSSLDMSIGARAALSEHLRHIARYGLDGQQNVVLQPGERDGLDEEWDRLMDGNASLASWSTANNNDSS